ncbi:regulatory protein [Pantoea rodasii]|uniref:Regulatory protein n=2 Tax=Pantoea rodasii TaxID=1076549 RepID=A0A0B1RES2_9GAMM|nr:regulatory protein [Pantoea rodasii]
MERANTRKSDGTSVHGRHLLSLAHKALLRTRQTEVARRLNVADSTILRRTEKYPEIMETLAASGVEDFVLRGEMKVPLDQYRWLLTVAIQFAEYELERTKEKTPDCVNSTGA